MPYSRGCVFWKLHIFTEAGEGWAGSMEPLEALGLLPGRPDQGPALGLPPGVVMGTEAREEANPGAGVDLGLLGCADLPTAAPTHRARKGRRQWG